MASKGPRSKLDHDTRARRLKALEPPKEPHRPKTHWDHVLEEMVWLSKDFESERKWKITQAKKVALRASKGKLDQATRGEKRMKEEEQRMRKIASNISKDVKKFWTKIEKLVLYKYQLELDDKKKKALDKQLEYLLGQTERYSNMLAENLLGATKASSSAQPTDMHESLSERQESSELNTDASHELLVDDESVKEEVDNDFAIDSDDDTGDDEQTLEEDEALITEEERKEELEALQDEVNLPIEKLLQQYSMCEVNRETSPEVGSIVKQSPKEADPNGRVDFSATDKIDSCRSPTFTDNCVRSNGFLHSPEDHLSDHDICQAKNIGKDKSSSGYEPMDNEINYDQDDETSLEEELAQAESNGTADEMALLQKESEIPVEQLLARYKDSCNDGSDRDSTDDGSEYDGSHSDSQYNFSDDQEDGDFDLLTDEEKDDETTLEKEEMARPESSSPMDEIALLQKESEIPVEVLLARYDEEPAYHESERELTLEHMDYDDFSDDQEDGEFSIDAGEDKDDETTLEEEEELAQAEPGSPVDEVALLQKDSDISIHDLWARYKDSSNNCRLEHDNGSSNSTAYSEPPGPIVDPDIEPAAKATSGVVNDISGDLHPDSPSCREATLAEPVISSEGGSERENVIADAAAAARSAQPTGNTLSTTSVRTKLPFLLKNSLREYQHIGLDWLVTMYEKKLNGILADEMGLGKTIMTIALLAHLACEKGIWGPHLIVVPTSVMLNWETEFLKWCPALKILTYFGSAKERKHKRQGWMKPNSFHVCITTYRLVIQDSKIFKRKKWKYLILDEAHLIKNWKSQRWQTLLNFNSKRRILLTGTPLQNDLMELWSLMHFLMPHVFQSHQEFKDWFCNPISGMVEGQERVNKEVVDRLHNVLRPFILRRLKKDVETQLPKKREHVVCCRLSKRQRNLYEDFIASSETQATLASTNFFGMLSIIMQLRKVCNHPDLFEGRPIVSSFDMDGIKRQLSSNICSILQNPFSCVDLSGLGFLFTHLDFSMASWEADEIQSIATPSKLIEDRSNLLSEEASSLGLHKCSEARRTNIFVEIRRAIWEQRVKEAKDRATALAWWNSLRCQKRPVYGTALRDLVTVEQPVHDIHHHKSNRLTYEYSSKLRQIILSPVERFMTMIDEVESFMFTIPPARAPPPVCWCSKPSQPVIANPSFEEECSRKLLPLLTPFRPAIVRRQLYFPDRRLIQFDCGKLQQLAGLLRRLKSEGHRALIFTQMTKMLDILEAFINLYGYTYMRLDGSTQPEERQTLMQRFNTNPKIFLFILSTRSGGVGINLVGADTVIFYDSDWNPAMDQQAQDRCHRIGQTREVHIYRLVSESTIEENILKKANQKRALDDLVIQSGGYNTEFLKKLDPMELFSGHKVGVDNIHHQKRSDNENEDPMSNADLEAALKLAEDEADYMALKRVELEEAVDNQEFTEETIGRPEDDDIANEDDTRVDQPADQRALDTPTSKEIEPAALGNDLDGEKALVSTCDDDDVDMLADVKQLAAAAAAAGHASSSFENQLRPIDRYAIRFLEKWDPIIDKSAVDYQDKFEEAEWELERLEKLKEDMEAEIDEDEEPLVYESWDADFATEAYRLQVQTLAQHQLMEELEQQAKEKEMKESRLSKKDTAGGSKSKSRRKSKKVKFKSLKKGSMLVAHKSEKGDGTADSLLSDDDYTSTEMVSSPETPSTDIFLSKKRKNLDTDLESEEENTPKVKFKKAKKINLVQCLPSSNSSLLNANDGIKNLKSNDVGIDQKLKPATKGKTGGTISISAMPIKRFFMIKPEKLKKKGNLWSSNFLPSPDAWWAQEDAILCALVHEYGPNWCLVSDILFGMTAGGFYRGRFRHHVHCCERFRELIQKYVVKAADSLSNDKACNTGSSKSLLKVSEENVQVLLDAAMKFQDRELLIQKHFTALLSTVWRMKLCHDRQKTVPPNGLSGIRLLNSGANTFAQRSLDNMGSLPQGHKLVSTALLDVDNTPWEDATSASNQVEDGSLAEETMEVTLEFPWTGDTNDVLPSTVMLTIPGRDLPYPDVTPRVQEDQFRCSHQLAEMRVRAAASGTCLADHLNWASSAFSCDAKSHSQGSKSHTLGKHKLSSPASETNKASKLKIRKITNSGDENHQMSQEPGLLSLLPSALTNICSLNTDISSFPVEDPTMGLISDTHLCNLNDELHLETIGSELVPHCYTIGFISGLDDCPLLPEFCDVG